MCMSFILQMAQRGCERELRGIQRLLCTLLCTRSNPCTNQVRPSAAPSRRNSRLVTSAEIVRHLLQSDLKHLGIPTAVRASFILEDGAIFRDFLPPSAAESHILRLADAITAFCKATVSDSRSCSRFLPPKMRIEFETQAGKRL